MILHRELLLVIVLGGIALLAPKLGDDWLRRIESGPRRLSPRAAILLVFFSGIALRAALLPVEPVPIPGIQDEFGYLLAADTFSHGRLTNPPHPVWKHFESMTIIQQPTYCSAFWPAQGFFLAVGQTVFRHPFWGVCLSFGLMCAAICWALQAWMPPGWALLGGVLAILRLGVLTYWANSYWGGAVAALGGALVFGALPRIRRRQRVRDVLLMALGLAVLANSRPYEGLFYSLPFIVALGTFILSRRSRSPGALARKIFLPLGLALALTFTLMAYYFWKTTGNPIRPPYMVDVATYIQEPPFIFQSLGPAKLYHNSVMQSFYGGYHVEMFLAAKHSPIVFSVGKLFYFWLFFLGVAFTAPFCILAGILPSRMSVRQLGSKALFFIAVIAVSVASLMPLPYMNPHYAAPVACVTYALVLQALRRIWIWDRRGRRRGVALVRAMVGTCILTFATSVTALALGVPRAQLFPHDPTGPDTARANIAAELNRQGGKHLIIVRYSPQHDAHDEWVYNDADINGSKVVWAREMDATEDQQLISYFKDRQVWRLEADEKPPRLHPTDASQPTTRNQE